MHQTQCNVLTERHPQELYSTITNAIITISAFLECLETNYYYEKL